MRLEDIGREFNGYRKDDVLRYISLTEKEFSEVIKESEAEMEERIRRYEKEIEKLEEEVRKLRDENSELRFRMENELKSLRRTDDRAAIFQEEKKEKMSADKLKRKFTKKRTEEGRNLSLFTKK